LRHTALPIVLAWLSLSATLASGQDERAGDTGDLEVVKARLVERARGGGAPDPTRVRELVDGLEARGSWPDVDYADQNRSGWRTPAHLNNLEVLARAASASDADPALHDAAGRALSFWLEHDFINPNWWCNQIGVPRRLLGPLLLLWDELDEETRARAVAILSRAKLGMTGQNRVWVSDITLARACLTGDAELAKRAVSSAASTLSIGGAEGIQADLSFFQHGRCLYSGGYGLSFAADMARLAALTRDTRLAFSAEKTDLLTRYVLDGQQWMMRGQTFDWGAVGREISRKGKNGRAMAEAGRWLALLDTQRRDELEALVRRIEAKPEPGDPVLSGNRHFYRGELMVHHRPGFLVSIRTCSNRIDNTDDPCNSEGLLSHHIADGVTFLYRSGDEYRDVFGAWDWERIPGATIERQGLRGTPRRTGTSPFAGGVSDGRCGVAAFDLVLGELEARKAWFCFDDEVLCLAAGIHCPSANPVVTAVDQRLARGIVTVGRAGGATPLAASGRHDLGEARWIHHDGIGYVFSPGSDVYLETGARREDWHRINHVYPPSETTRDLFDLWISHGASPRQAVAAYHLLPDASAEETAVRAEQPTVRLVANRPQVQAAWHSPTSRLGIVFREAGVLELPPDVAAADGLPLRVAVNAPVLLLMRFDEAATEIHSADPLARGTSVELELNRRRDGTATEASRIVLRHPGGPVAGRSVTYSAD